MVKKLLLGLMAAGAALGVNAKEFATCQECNGRGEFVNVDIGRQLFVDDYVIGATNGVVRHWNRPVKAQDPVVWPGCGAGTGVMDGGKDANLTCATDGGLWWDPTRGKYRLWYQANWIGHVCYAESVDGFAWTYPDLGVVKGTNRVFDRELIDSWSVVPDYAAENPYSAWKLYISEPGGYTDDRLWTSADGLRFEPLGRAGASGDRSSLYYDPFRGNWVFSLRAYYHGRSRRYFASRSFGGPDCRWAFVEGEWRSDTNQVAASEWLFVTNRPNWQLYSFNAVAYESLMLGAMQILHNTKNDNKSCARVGLPKYTAIHYCFSRDGKTFVPRDEADIAPEGWGSGKWDTGYLSPVGGICTMDDDRIVFYYNGLRGDSQMLKSIACAQDCAQNGMYANGAIGSATLRRDGFAGLVADGKGEVLTKRLDFTGNHLFVNAECRFGSLCAEIVGADGRPIPGFTFDDCVPIVRKDVTKAELVFRGGDLSRLGKRGVRVRFSLRCATLYSFWLSPSARGESRGYVAAGGPSYSGLRDL